VGGCVTLRDAVAEIALGCLLGLRVVLLRWSAELRCVVVLEWTELDRRDVLGTGIALTVRKFLELTNFFVIPCIRSVSARRDCK